MKVINFETDQTFEVSQKEMMSLLRLQAGLTERQNRANLNLSHDSFQTIIAILVDKELIKSSNEKYYAIRRKI